MQLIRTFKIYGKSHRKGMYILSLTEATHPYPIIGQLAVTESPLAPCHPEVQCTLTAGKQPDRKIDGCLYFYGIVSTNSQPSNPTGSLKHTANLFSTPYAEERPTALSRLKVRLTAQEYAIWRQLKALSLVAFRLKPLLAEKDAPMLILPDPITMFVTPP